MAIIGNNPSSGTENGPFSADTQVATKFSMFESGTITEIGVKARHENAGNTNAALYIYDSALDSGSGKYAPDNVIDHANLTLGDTSIWRSATGLSIPIGAIDFWIKLIVEDSYFIDYTSGSTDQSFACWGRGGVSPWTFPDSYAEDPQAFTGSEGWDPAQFLMYIAYTPDAAPTETRFIFAPIGGTYIGAPMLEVSGDVEVTPSAISVEMNVISPVVTGDSNTAPSVISTELNVISPIVTADVDVIPATISNDLNVIDPVVTGDSDFTPAVISSEINVISPVVSGDSNIEVSVISVTLNVISPTVTSEIEVLASVIEAELNSISPVVTGDAETIPSVISLEMNSISPLVSGDSNVSVSTISTNLSVISPIVFSDVDIAAESINVSLNINSPSVIGDSDTDVNVISAELGVISPLVIGDSNTNISTISALLNVLIPIVTNGETTYYAVLRYWNGSSYQKGVVRVRINGVWVRKQIRLRLDNEWKLIDCNG